MGTVLQALNLFATLAAVFLLWSINDRQESRDQRIGQGVGVLSRFRKKVRFKPIKHERASGTEVPILGKNKRVNYYVPRGDHDVEPFVAEYVKELSDGVPADSYVVEGHVIPGGTFRELYEVSKAAVSLDRPVVDPGAPRINVPTRHRVTFEEYPKVGELNEEELRKLAEEYDLVDPDERQSA